MSAETKQESKTVSDIKIETISIDGFKRLQQFRLDPDGKSVEISGRNGQGKSSVIDAVWVALTGKDVPGVPIHKGSVSAAIVVGLDSGHTVKLTWKGSGKKLVVEGPDGEPVKAPAAFLENLIGQISFDPFAFVEEQPAKQKAFLQMLLGLDFSDLDARKSKALAEKRDLDAEGVQIERNLDDLADAKDTARVDVGALLLAQEQRQEKIKSLERASRTMESVDQEIAGHTYALESIAAEHAELLRKLDALKVRETENTERMEATRERKEVGAKLIVDLTAEAESLEDPTEAIRNAGETNKAADAWDRRLALLESKKTLADAVAKNSEKLGFIEKDREQRLFDAKFPVDGLSFSTDGVLFQGLPFDKGNQCVSDILRVGVAIAVAQNPALKIVRIKDGSLLDAKSKREVLSMLNDHGFQAFVETVTDTDLTALVIEETEGE